MTASAGQQSALRGNQESGGGGDGRLLAGGGFLIHHVNSLTDRKFPVPPQIPNSQIDRKPSRTPCEGRGTVF